MEQINALYNKLEKSLKLKDVDQAWDSINNYSDLLGFYSQTPKQLKEYVNMLNKKDIPEQNLKIFYCKF